MLASAPDGDQPAVDETLSPKIGRQALKGATLELARPSPPLGARQTCLTRATPDVGPRPSPTAARRIRKRRRRPSDLRPLPRPASPGAAQASRGLGAFRP